MKVEIAPNTTTELKPLPYNKDNYELPVEQDSKILAKYISAAMHYATVNNIEGEMEEKTVHHEFSNKSIKASQRKQSNKYQPFVTKWEAGDIKMATSEQKSRAKHAEGQPEPLAKLIIGTVGTYAGNLRNDLKELFKKDSPGRVAFLELYAENGTDFNNALNGLLDRDNLTHQDIKDVFDGYEAHHVIPANFLWENTYIKELLAQPGINFGFNNLDNLVYIPTDNHRENGQRCHKKYDQYIKTLINSRLKSYMEGDDDDDESVPDYLSALEELKMIVAEVKVRFKNEVLKPNGVTLDSM